MTIDPAALLALARAATPGPWKWSNPPSLRDPDDPGSLGSDTDSVIYATGGDGYSGYIHCDPPDAAYIAAASPDVIIALCELTERLAQLAVERYEEAEELRAALGEPTNTTRPMISSMRERIESLERDRSRIKAERDLLFAADAKQHDEERPIRTEVRLAKARIAALEAALGQSTARAAEIEHALRETRETAETWRGAWSRWQAWGDALRFAMDGQPRLNGDGPTRDAITARISALDAGLKEACDLAQYLSDNLEGDATEHDQRITALRSLAEAKL